MGEQSSVQGNVVHVGRSRVPSEVLLHTPFDVQLVSLGQQTFVFGHIVLLDQGVPLKS